MVTITIFYMKQCLNIKRFFPYIIAGLLCILFTLAAISINLNRFWQYEAGYYDFGIFDRAIWLVSRFQPPIIDHFRVSGKLIFADHFSPSIFLLSPLYWLTDKSEILFVAQDILVAASGLVLFLIGIKVLKNAYLSLTVLIAYFLFVGLQNAILHDFHEVTVMTFFLMMTYFAIFKKDKKLYFLFLILTLGFKESIFILGVGLSLFIYFFNKKWKNVAVATFLLSIAWGIVAIKIIIPHFAGTFYYAPETTQGGFNLLLRTFDSPLKIKTIFLIFLSFAFLPLLNIPLTLIVFSNLAQRFILDSTTRWDLGLHYNAEIAPTLAVASVLGLYILQKKFSKRIAVFAAALLIIISVSLYQFVLHGPFGLAYHPVFYQHTKDFVFLDKMIATIPKNAKVVAQNNLASRLLHHQEIWILREDYRRHNADYILLDVRPGQNPNNHLGIKDTQKILIDLLADPDYEIFYHEGEQYVFRRIRK